jgi:cytochrome P450
MIDEYDPSTIDPERPTVVDDIMAAAQADPSLFIDGELMMAVLGPYFAGLDTVANTTASLVYAVLKHPEVYRRMMEEVDAAFANGVPTPAELRKMTVMHGIVMETLRLYPIGVALVRNADESFTFNGYRVDEGEPIYMASTVSHFLPEFYPDPYTFDIDRYQKPRVEHRQPGAFAPFSLGAHTCLGAGMAEVQIMLTMATLFHRLRLELDPLDYELKQKVAPTPGPESKFKVRVVGRRQ